MLKHEIANKSNNVLFWSIEVDSDGDLVLTANTKRVLYIDTVGALFRYPLSPDLGLVRDHKDRIQLGEYTNI